MSTFNDMADFFRAARLAPELIVPCAYGPTGIGKTAAISKVAADSNSRLIVIIASQILPNEISGITMPDPETKAMMIYDHYRLGNLRPGDIIFFDELLEADQLVLSALLTLIESRALMSGKKIPDGVMICAATNQTIKPSMLKENIRQRFVWRKFDIDPEGTREYIKETYGFDVGDLVNQLKSTGDEYNILSPRSLTKMAGWIASTSTDEEAKLVAKQINLCWTSNLGTKLLDRYQNRLSPNQQRRKRFENVAMSVLEENGKSIDVDFQNTSMTELIEILSTLPEWEEIENRLSTTTSDVKKEEVTF